MNRSGKRMAVLRDEEIKQIYGLPRFTEEQRNTYFSLNPSEKQEVTKLQSVKTKVYLVVLQHNRYYHISDTYIALFSNFIPCGVHEGTHILDIFKEDLKMRPNTLHGDTHAQSEVVIRFGVFTRY